MAQRNIKETTPHAARTQILSSGEEGPPEPDWTSKHSIWTIWLQVKQELMHEIEATLHNKEHLILRCLKDLPGSKPAHVNNDREKSSNVRRVSPRDFPKENPTDSFIYSDSFQVVNFGDTIPGEVFEQPQVWQDTKAWECATPPSMHSEKLKHLPLPNSCESPAKLAWDANVKAPRKPSKPTPAPPTNAAPLVHETKASTISRPSRLCFSPPPEPIDEEIVNKERKELSRMDYWLSMTEKWMERMKIKTKEPKHTGVLAKIERSSVFHAVCLLVILIDAAYTAWSSNRSAHHPGIKSTGGMKVTESLFTIFYLCELIIKLVVHKKYFFFNNNWNWNWFDFCLVIQSFIDTFMTYILDSDGENVTFMRILRLMKIGKILRVFRAIRFLRDLRAMIVAIVNCMSALFWAFITLALVLYVFALMIVQSMTAHIADNPSLSVSVRNDITTFFGSLETTALTLYMCTTGGISWIEVYNIVEDVGALEILAFIFFIGFFGFAVITILSGIFIEKALVATQPDRDSMALELRRVDEQDTHQLRDLLSSMDNNKNGRLSFDEFSTALEDMHVQAYLRSLGLAVNDAAMFFDLLAHQSGSEDLPITDLCQRMCRMKGAATSMDLQSLMFEVSLIRKLVIEVLRATGSKSGTAYSGWKKVLNELANERKHTEEFQLLKRETQVFEDVHTLEPRGNTGNNGVDDDLQSECTSEAV